MIFYCKPYAKAANERRNQQNQYNGIGGGVMGAAAQSMAAGYGETISKPSFIIKEKEKEIFLNGELQHTKKTLGYGEQGRTMKKTLLCLKGLKVESMLSQEAIRNTYALKSILGEESIETAAQ